MSFLIFSVAPTALIFIVIFTGGLHPRLGSITSPRFWFYWTAIIKDSLQTLQVGGVKMTVFSLEGSLKVAIGEWGG